MKKLLVVSVVVMLVVGLIVTPVLAKGKDGPAGKSNNGHLYLYEKDPSTWEIVEGGAWGKMKYNLSGPELCVVFNGHRLVPGEKYSLIYYEDPGPGPWTVYPDIICLGSAKANKGGNVHIEDCTNTGDLPTADDVNEDGAKIWLVLSSDVDCDNGKMAGWTPTEYLFENNLLSFDDTDAPLDLRGDWLLSYVQLPPGGGTYNHDMTISSQSPDGSFSGTGSWPAGIWTWKVTGIITDSTVSMTITYDQPVAGTYPYVVSLTGIVGADGSSMSGTATDNRGHSYTWTATLK